MTEYFNIDATPPPRFRRPRLSQWLFKRGLGSLIIHGTLALRLPDGTTRSFGQGAPEIAITIHDWRTLRRIAFNPDLAIGEAWMDGWHPDCRARRYLRLS